MDSLLIRTRIFAGLTVTWHVVSWTDCVSSDALHYGKWRYAGIDLSLPLLCCISSNLLQQDPRLTFEKSNHIIVNTTLVIAHQKLHR